MAEAGYTRAVTASHRKFQTALKRAKNKTSSNECLLEAQKRA